MFDATQLRCAFLEPPSIDARLVHQQGLFSVLSPETDMEALLMSHPTCARKIIVPAWLKREVRDKLDAIGVSERTLFPGLDGLCTWLRRYYTKVRATLSWVFAFAVCAPQRLPHAAVSSCVALRCVCALPARLGRQGDGRRYSGGAPPERSRLGSRRSDAPPTWPEEDPPAEAAAR